MQLGTRWSVGSPPPERLPELMKAAIVGVEAERRTESPEDVTQWRWTLTWLEGHPRAELDDGTTVRQDYDGAIIVERADLDEDEADS